VKLGGWGKKRSSYFIQEVIGHQAATSNSRPQPGSRSLERIYLTKRQILQTFSISQTFWSP